MTDNNACLKMDDEKTEVGAVVYKKCSGECGLEKVLCKENFYWRNDKNKYNTQCKVCVKIKSKKYYYENTEKISEKAKEYNKEHKNERKEYKEKYYQKNKDEIKKETKQYYQEHKGEIKEYYKKYNQENKDNIRKNKKQYRQGHKDEITEYGKQYRKEHKNELKEYNKQYNQENKNKLNEYKKEYTKNRRQNDPEYKLHKNISRSVYGILKDKKGGKSVLKHLPYTMKELRKHIEDQFEPWMTWDNYGVYNKKTHKENPTWQLDHIRPHSEFHYEDMECQEFQDCWALSNLRPLDSEKNLMDGVNRTRHKKASRVI